MCGIIAVASSEPFLNTLFENLAFLEYRGYDSAGVAVLYKQNLYCEHTIEGIENLKNSTSNWPPHTQLGLGIAHTRWATHGQATIQNAHPQSNGEIAIVHNGIIENYAELKKELPDIVFKSQTDTEVIVHMMSKEIKKGETFLNATHKVTKKLRGTFALAIICRAFPNKLILTKRSNPLSVGLGNKEWKGSIWVSSDIAAISPCVEKYLDLEDNEICVIDVMPNGTSEKNQSFICSFFDKNLQPCSKNWIKSENLGASARKGDFKNFTLKEIFEQPKVIEKALASIDNTIFSDMLKNNFPNAINFIGCGSSFFAGSAGKYLFEKYGKIAASVDIASEFRYRKPFVLDNSLNIFISQSGETIDTLSSQVYVKELGLKTTVITNVLYSSMAKTADYIVPLNAGPELGVVSTKAFSAQLALIVCLLINFLKRQKTDLQKIKKDEPPLYLELLEDFSRVPYYIRNILDNSCIFDQAAEILKKAKSAIFIARGELCPIAFEGALKLRESSYIHSDGYPAGELKHGTIAIIDETVVTVVFAPSDELFEKVLSNVQEILARKGKIIFVTDKKGIEYVTQQNIQNEMLLCEIPKTGEVSKMFAYCVVGQIIAYKTAMLIGNNIDRPRNLAKSVTVE